ncbi:MAG: DUF697 domain-containing protein [Cytophagales bacterium]|nr:MAG: DUF697 domain-containing protein [Cytophagales bacterium]TAF61198.1 MAG: DUF697 domain-containing protein [Cytophagales bacterium]
MSELKEKSERVVKLHVAWSMGAGLIPVPIIDMIAVTAVQVDMLRQISTIYGHNFSESAGKSFISALSGTYLARLGAQAIKAIPGIGSLIGGISMAVLSGASTYAIGMVFIKHFETGGNLFNFNPDSFKQFYKDQFEKGKKVAADIKKEEDVKKTAQKDPIAKIKELSDLRDRGIISDEEFQRMKEKIMQSV